MPIATVSTLKALLPPKSRLLGLDVGDKTIGMAISDPGLMVASPVGTIRRVKFTRDADALIALIGKDGVGGLVIGLPVNMDGSEGPRCQSVRRFGDNMLTRIELPILFWDERLSTAAVTRALIAADVSRKRRAEVVDTMAAAYILQGALDALARSGNTR